jgi:hypothetical protein
VFVVAVGVVTSVLFGFVDGVVGGGSKDNNNNNNNYKKDN